MGRKVLYCLILGCLAVATTGISNPGYLAIVGPVPLRFERVPRPPAKKFVLPIPPPEPVADQPKMPTKPLPSSTLSEHVASGPATPPPPAPPQMGPAGQSALAPAPQEGAISPQMLLKFFNKTATSTNSTSVIAPMDFSPPGITAPPPPSAATIAPSP